MGYGRHRLLAKDARCQCALMAAVRAVRRLTVERQRSSLQPQSPPSATACYAREPLRKGSKGGIAVDDRLAVAWASARHPAHARVHSHMHVHAPNTAQHSMITTHRNTIATHRRGV